MLSISSGSAAICWQHDIWRVSRQHWLIFRAGDQTLSLTASRGALSQRSFKTTRRHAQELEEMQVSVFRFHWIGVGETYSAQNNCWPSLNFHVYCQECKMRENVTEEECDTTMHLNKIRFLPTLVVSLKLASASFAEVQRTKNGLTSHGLGPLHS